MDTIPSRSAERQAAASGPDPSGPDLSGAARTLWQSTAAGSTIADLDAAMRPRTRAEGYAVQALVPGVAGQSIVGWKIAGTSQAGRDHINVAEPLAGRILESCVHRSGDIVSLAGNRMLVAELEFSFLMGRDLAPRAQPYSVEEVLAATSALVPAIELPSSRFLDFTKAGEPQLIADCACAGQFVFAPTPAGDWRGADLAAFPTLGRITRAGTTVLERPGTGANVMGDPRVALTWLANELRQVGVTLAAGMRVSTGTCLPPLEIQAGDHVYGDFGRFGSVSAKLVA